jgi:transposase
MITIGVDFHKRTSSYKVLDENGQHLKSTKFENSREAIREFLEAIPGPKKLAMEATRSWGLFYDSANDLVDEFHLGHPKKMKVITQSQTKNDKRDTNMIAKLLHSGFFPEAHVSSIDTRELRSLLRFRHFLVNDRRSIRNQVQTLIDRHVWASDRPKSFKNVFCLRGLKWLKELDLPERERFILSQCLKTFQELGQKISDLEKFIQSQTLELPGLEYLRTVPGFKLGKVNALIVLTEADGMNRFPKARSFSHYAGLIPSEYSSGDKHRTGRLIKDANMHLRTAFIESTFAAIRADKGLKAYYKQVKERSGSGSAVIATARKLSYAVYHVLKEQRAYRPQTLPPAAVCHP